MTFGFLAADANAMPSINETRFSETDLELLFKQYFKPLCLYAQFRFGFDLDMAKEVVHTGFIRLWENRENVSMDQSIKAYLYKIVTNSSLDQLKHEKVKQKHARQTIQNIPSATPLKNFNDPELKQLLADIEKAVGELPGQMRKIFELSRYDGLKYAEIASRMGISVKTVETQMSRALVRLRQRLLHYLPVLAMGLLINQ